MQSTGLNRSRGLPPPRFQNPVRLSSVWQGQDVSSELLRWQTTHEATTVMLKMYRDPGSRDVRELGTSVKESHRKQPEPAQERGCTDCSWLGHRSRDFKPLKFTPHQYESLRQSLELQDLMLVWFGFSLASAWSFHGIFSLPF